MSANESLYRWVKLSKHCADTGDTRTAVRTDLPLISQPKRPPMRTKHAHDLCAAANHHSWHWLAHNCFDRPIPRRHVFLVACFNPH